MAGWQPDDWMMPMDRWILGDWPGKAAADCRFNPLQQCWQDRDGKTVPRPTRWQDAKDPQ